MKPNHPHLSSASRLPLWPARSRLIRLLITALCLTTVAALWAQSRRALATRDDLQLREFSDLAILEPAAVTEVLRKVQTPEEAAAAARARLAIEDPATHAVLYAPLAGGRLAAHEKAVHDFIHPFQTSVEMEEQRKDAAYRQAEAGALQAIRNPVPSEQE